jgi:hypothetical protein
MQLLGMVLLVIANSLAACRALHIQALMSCPSLTRSLHLNGPTHKVSAKHQHAAQCCGIKQQHRSTLTQHITPPGQSLLLFALPMRSAARHLYRVPANQTHSHVQDELPCSCWEWCCWSLPTAWQHVQLFMFKFSCRAADQHARCNGSTHKVIAKHQHAAQCCGMKQQHRSTLIQHITPPGQSLLLFALPMRSAARHLYRVPAHQTHSHAQGEFEFSCHASAGNGVMSYCQQLGRRHSSSWSSCHVLSTHQAGAAS